MGRQDTSAKRKQRAKIVVRELKRLFPTAKISLNFSNHWELYVAVVLSAQCTDKKVNEVTEKLFEKYKDLDDYIKADLSEFENDIRQTGFFRNKAKSILAAAELIKEDHGGKIPCSMEELLKIPGVGRKTANVILVNACGAVEGIAVDTHVKRLSKVFGLTDHNDPQKIEQDLMRIIPREEWFDFTHRMIAYGRTYCPAKPHNHSMCPLSKILDHRYAAPENDSRSKR